MKKTSLNVFIVIVLIALMTTCLFACDKDEPEEPGQDKRRRQTRKPRGNRNRATPFILSSI